MTTIVSNELAKMMTLKEQLLQELDRIPTSHLELVMNFVVSLQAASQDVDERGWQAYLQSEQEREEVYRRLANS